MVALAVLGVLTMSISCSGNYQRWARVACAVAREGVGALEGVNVSFLAQKVEQSGKVPYEPRFKWTATTVATGWTPQYVCGPVSLKYDERSTEFLEDIRIIAAVNDDGNIYYDTVDHTPEFFLNDTQGVSMRIDLPPLK
jgi:hypothetical protein